MLFKKIKLFFTPRIIKRNFLKVFLLSIIVTSALVLVESAHADSASSVTSIQTQSITIPDGSYTLNFGVNWTADDVPMYSHDGRIELVNSIGTVVGYVNANVRFPGNIFISSGSGSVSNRSAEITRYTFLDKKVAEGDLDGTWNITGVASGDYTLKFYNYDMWEISQPGNKVGDLVHTTTFSKGGGVPLLPPPTNPIVSFGTCSDAEIVKPINFSWDPPASASLIGFNIYRNGVYIDSTAWNVTTYQDKTTTAGISYTYSVKAAYVGGESAPATATSIIAQACPGTGTCTDGIQNGDETGIDTGGRCGGGGGGGTCTDGIQNGDETGIDTGGRCGGGGGGGTCTDGIQNGDETGIDTGGRCGGVPGSPAIQMWLNGNESLSSIRVRAGRSVTVNLSKNDSTMYDSCSARLDGDKRLVDITADKIPRYDLNFAYTLPQNLLTVGIIHKFTMSCKSGAESVSAETESGLIELQIQVVNLTFIED